jgi:hypothetical protein
MQSLNPALSSSWRTRARDLLLRLVRPSPSALEARSFVVWAEMKPIDFEGEDSSLSETDLRRLK